MSRRKRGNELQVTWLEITQDVRKLQANSEQGKGKSGLLEVVGGGGGEAGELFTGWARGWGGYRGG